MRRRGRMIMRMGIMWTRVLMELFRLRVWKMGLRQNRCCVMKWSTNSG